MGMTQSVHELLHEYHRRIDEAFLQPGTTPYRLSKNLWQIYGAMARELAMLPACTWLLCSYSDGCDVWEAGAAR